MSENIHIYTKTRQGLDNKIWLTMLIFLIVASGVLGFRVATAPKMVSFEINQSAANAVGPSKYKKDSDIALSAATTDKNTVHWNFGDGSQGEDGISVKHKFTTAGVYHITAKINGFASNNELIDTIVVPDVQPAPTPVVAKPVEENLIDGPSGSITVGSQQNFTCKGKAGACEWSVENDPEHPRPQTGDVATYSFNKPGPKTIVLTTHNPDHVSKLTVDVLEAEHKKTPAISHPQAAKPKVHKKDDGGEIDLDKPLPSHKN